MNTIWIVLIITVGVIVVVWMLRDRITRLFVKSPDWEGGMDAAPPSQQLPPPSSQESRSDYSIDFSDNQFSGSGGTFRVSRDSFRARKNKIRGDRDFIFEDPGSRPQSDDSEQPDKDA